MSILYEYSHNTGYVHIECETNKTFQNKVIFLFNRFVISSAELCGLYLFCLILY